ncbi:hypothetical protein ABZ234_04020 [Nocardiopsis sp. NPDC006198]|uniref:hypothetical protein n=1 Tax=Nocardiopsis sp. NPDC006198 TaxID=3154472 RepID=UPI0033A23D96
MNDHVFVAFMTDLWGGGHPADDLWKIALLDTDPEPAVIDPAMEALAARDIAAAELPDRDIIRADHPFPIDSDEEVQW